MWLTGLWGKAADCRESPPTKKCHPAGYQLSPGQPAQFGLQHLRGPYPPARRPPNLAQANLDCEWYRHPQRSLI
jgi:hypothetical protein